MPQASIFQAPPPPAPQRSAYAEMVPDLDMVLRLRSFLDGASLPSAPSATTQTTAAGGGLASSSQGIGVASVPGGVGNASVPGLTAATRADPVSGFSSLYNWLSGGLI